MKNVYEMYVTRRDNSGVTSFSQRYFKTHEAATAAMGAIILELVQKEDSRERGRRCQETTWKIVNHINGVSLYKNEDKSEDFVDVTVSIFKQEVEG